MIAGMFLAGIAIAGLVIAATSTTADVASTGPAPTSASSPEAAGTAPDSIGDAPRLGGTFEGAITGMLNELAGQQVKGFAIYGRATEPAYIYMDMGPSQGLDHALAERAFTVAEQQAGLTVDRPFVGERRGDAYGACATIGRSMCLVDDGTTLAFVFAYERRSAAEELSIVLDATA